ncbi:hypothetical protein KUCAC02_037351, partial [Chaenocephalus aceratus]
RLLLSSEEETLVEWRRGKQVEIRSPQQLLKRNPRFDSKHEKIIMINVAHECFQANDRKQSRWSDVDSEEL